MTVTFDEDLLAPMLAGWQKVAYCYGSPGLSLTRSVKYQIIPLRINVVEHFVSLSKVELSSELPRFTRLHLEH
jgi:hypothetical protein